MTHAFNRRAFFSRGAIEWARSQRSGRPLAVITSDIDFFKKVNDTHGHHVGDLVIKDYAHRAAQMLRLPDILARFGGEEFVILLPETDIEALISEADAALYRAKPGGRNRVEA
jgi:diguanylate cyclase (GGDEF)-like protein